jgi:hypothetical protein
MSASGQRQTCAACPMMSASSRFCRKSRKSRAVLVHQKYHRHLRSNLIAAVCRFRSRFVNSHAADAVLHVRMRKKCVRRLKYSMVSTRGLFNRICQKQTSALGASEPTLPLGRAGSLPYGRVTITSRQTKNRVHYTQAVKIDGPRFRNWLPMITRCISDVPSQIRSTRTSRFNRSTAFSRI